MNAEYEVDIKLTIKKTSMPVIDWMEDAVHRIVHFGEFIDRLKLELEENDVVIRDIIYPKDDVRDYAPFIIFDIDDDYRIKFSTNGTILKDSITVTLSVCNVTVVICNIKCKYNEPCKIMTWWSPEQEHQARNLENKLRTAIDNVIAKHSVEIISTENDT